MKDKIKNYFFLDEEDDDEIVSPPPSQVKQPVQQQHAQPVQQNTRPFRPMKERKVIAPENNNNVVNLQVAPSPVASASDSSKVILVEPRVYAEAQTIAEHLKNKRATIVNLQRIDRDEGIRIIDFLSGTVYALGGDIQRVGKDIFLCAPDNVEVSGEISHLLTEDF